MTWLLLYVAVGLTTGLLCRLEECGPIPLRWWLYGLLLWPLIVLVLVASLLARVVVWLGDVEL